MENYNPEANWDDGSCGEFSGCPDNGDYSLSFDGWDDYAIISNENNFDITDSITISAWIKHKTGNPGMWEDMIMKGNTSYGFQFYYVLILFLLRY